MTFWFRTKGLCARRCYGNITTKWQVVSYTSTRRLAFANNCLRTIYFLGFSPENMPAWMIDFICCGKWMNGSIKILSKRNYAFPIQHDVTN